MADQPHVLLFGPTGQVGYEILRQCQDYQITVVPQFDHDGQKGLDLTDLSVIAERIAEVKPNFIINAAAYTQVDQAEDESQLVDQINAEAPAVMAEAGARIGATLIHYSTDYVYNGEGKEPFTEDSTPAPLSKYGSSKLRGDQNILETAANAFILRTSWVFGAHGHNFVKTMLRLATTKDQLSIVADQEGAPTSATCLAQGARRIMDLVTERGNHWAESQRGVFHLTNQGVTSWYGFAKEIFRLAPEYGFDHRLKEVKPITSDLYPTKAVRPKNSRLSIAKIERELGFVPKAWQLALQHDFFEHPLTQADKS